MQGTLATFDPMTRSGVVLLDDGRPVAFDGDAFARSGLRMLRLGQRLSLATDAGGRVTRITIPTLA